jgi:hypothetical protein
MDREQEDPGALADEMEEEASRLQHRSEELGEEVSDVRKDWERKRSDAAVPGANPPSEGSQDDSVASGTDETDSGGTEADDRSEQEHPEDQTSGQGSDVPSDWEAGHE